MDDVTYQRRAGVFVFCHDFYGGEKDPLYRILKSVSNRIKLSDADFRAIRCGKSDPAGNWVIARATYHVLKTRYLAPKPLEVVK
jgi:hypothetical protein